MTAINPHLMHNTINISQAGEPYIITYIKLKKILEKNKPKKIILGFGYHNISAFNDGKLSRADSVNEIFSRIYPLFSLETLNILDAIDINHFYFFRALFFNTMLYPHTDHMRYIGSFSKRNKSKLDKADVEFAINRHFYNGSIEYGVSAIQINFLEKILMLANKNDIKIFLVNPPLHRLYRENIPKKLKESYIQIKNKYITSGLHVLDYSEYKLDDKYFYDYDHLNSNGAELFTQIIDNIVSK
ncbi:MAG: DUF1574 family protein [Spirochaetales bacterium]|nr:DUF1574 family protein [Spirochaetales bacterium]